MVFHMQTHQEPVGKEIIFQSIVVHSLKVVQVHLIENLELIGKITYVISQG